MEWKKNLWNWLRANLDFGFQAGDCISCLNDPEEAEELEEGRPSCQVIGICKHFASCKSTAPRGNPTTHLYAGGLREFIDLSDRILSLSPFDGAELPSLQAYPWVSGTTPIPETEFQDLLAQRLNRLRNHIIKKRDSKWPTN